MTVNRSFGTIGISKAASLADQRKEEETQRCQHRHKRPRRRRVQRNPIEPRRALVSDKVVSEYHPCTSNTYTRKYIRQRLKRKQEIKLTLCPQEKTKTNPPTPFK